MTKFTQVYTPLLICCYAIIGFLAIYQMYLIQHHRSKLISWNSGFLCCCVPWCALRITYWLMPTDSCETDEENLLQNLILALPINLEFVCFYLIMVYIMSKVRKFADDAEFTTRLKWISVVAHVTYLATNLSLVVVTQLNGSRQPQQSPDADSDCNNSPAQKCLNNGGCFIANDDASELQQGLYSLSFFSLALSLFFYGLKLHISPEKPLAALTGDPAESMPQLRWHAHESRYVTEGVCIALLLVFVSRAVFDALQLNIFAPSPLSIPQNKDVHEFWIFFVYMAWEVFPCSLMLFFFGTINTPPKRDAKNEPSRRDWQNFSKPMTEGIEEDHTPVLASTSSKERPNPNWPLPADVHYVAEDKYSPLHHPVDGRQRSREGLMDDDRRYDSPSEPPLQMPNTNTTFNSGVLPEFKPLGRNDLYARTQLGAT